MAEKSVYTSSRAVDPASMVFKHLSNGVTTNANGDYSIVADTFKLTANTSSQKLYIKRMIIYIEDVGGFDSGKYGNNIVLTNGIQVGVYDSGGSMLLDLTDSKPIMHNAEWAAMCYDISLSSFGTGNESMAVRWTFGKSGRPLALSSGQYLAVNLNDDFTGLVSHNFLAQGIYS